MYKNIATSCFILIISLAGSLASSLTISQTPGSTSPQAQQYQVDDFLRDVKFNDAKSVKKALASGISPNSMDEKGNSALTIAITEKSLDVAKLLIDTPSIDLERPNFAGETPVMLAAYTGSDELVRYLVEKRQVEINKPGWSALHYAATNGHLKIVAYLLDKNAYVDPESPNRTTALMMAARGGHIQVVKLLLEHDADLSKINNVKMTAIDFAEQHNQTEIAEGLKSRWLKLYKKPYKSQVK
jgi:ankyrin repeat protein